jgi:hypothetical protein
LAADEEAIDKEHDHCADHATKKTCRFSGLVPANALPELSRNERADDSQNGRQDEAARLGPVARREEFRTGVAITYELFGYDRSVAAVSGCKSQTIGGLSQDLLKGFLYIIGARANEDQC